MTPRRAITAPPRTGQPLLVLAAILLIWGVARAAMWQSPFPLVLPPLPELEYANRQFSAGTEPVRHQPVRSPHTAIAASTQTSSPALLTPSGLADFYEGRALASRGQPLLASSAHQLMWLAAFEPQPSIPRSIVEHYSKQSAAGPLMLDAPAITGRPQRWSGSGWAFLRQGSGGPPALGGGIPAYGASQAGATIAFRLLPGSARQPAAYLRMTTALDQAEDVELALGLSLRPVPRLPVALMTEGRARRSGDKLVLRPALLAVTQLPRFDLAHGLVAEAYGQAGYVGGPDASGFADGQVRVTRHMADFKLGTVRAGAAAWGGAQKGATRLDLGPTAQLDLQLVDLPARLALDYRARVAGNAAPGSGFALTLSTGF